MVLYHTIAKIEHPNLKKIGLRGGKLARQLEEYPYRLFPRTIRARFLKRLNRFLVSCELSGGILHAFLPNPGRLHELLLPGAKLHLIREESPRTRKNPFTVVAVERNGRPIMLHTHRTNDVARFLLQRGKIPGLGKVEIVRSEVQIGKNRFDFLLRDGNEEIILEVKSCTLFGEKVAMFPDAVTERGRRHLLELASLSDEGRKTAVLFVVQWPFATTFMPDYHTDLEFSRAFLEVRERVQLLPVSVQWEEDLSLSPNVSLLDIPWAYVEQEAQDRGSYILVLHLSAKQKLPIGKLGTLTFPKGFYLYVGSAMGSLTARLQRHMRKEKKDHWHIDSLRAVSESCYALPIRSSERLECELAEALGKVAHWRVPGFGSTDCSCETHLFGMDRDPLQSKNFHRLLQYFRMDRFLRKSLSSS